MSKLTQNQLDKIPDDWNLHHKIHDLEYWFTGPDFDIQLVLDSYYEFWEINELKGKCECCGTAKGETYKHKKLDKAFFKVLSLMLDS